MAVRLSAKLVAALLIPIAALSSAGTAYAGSPKDAADNASHTRAASQGSYSGAILVPYREATPQEKYRIAMRDASATAALGQRDSTIKNFTEVRHFAQPRNYYCGPAAFKTILSARGYSASWETAASYTNVELNGGTNVYQMQDGLTRFFRGKGGSYEAKAVPGQKFPATAAIRWEFWKRIRANVSTGWASGAVLDEDDVRYSLAGHQKEYLPLAHWVGIYGYNGNASSGTMAVTDSMAGSPVYANWHGLQAYQTIKITHLAYNMGNGGYVF